MEFEREVLRDIIDIAISKCFQDGDWNAVKYTEYINLLLKLDSLVKDNKIIIIGIKD